MTPDSNSVGPELLAALLDLVVRLEADGTIASLSGSPELLFGMPASELVGRPMEQLLDPEHVRSFELLRGRVARGEAPAPRELRFRHTAGHEVWLEVALRAMPEHGGVLLGARDVTIRRSGVLAL